MPEDAATCPKCNSPVRNSQQSNRTQNQPHQQSPQGPQNQPRQQPPQGPQNQPRQQPPQGSQSQSSSGFLSNISIVGGTIYGVAAFVVSLTIHSLLLLSSISSTTSEGLADTAGEGAWFLIGWMFYNAHTVPIESTVAGTSGNLLEGVYQLAGSAIAVPKITFYALPIAVLALLGHTLANRATQPDVNPLHSAIAGASIALGYGIFSVLGSYVFTLDVLGESAGPEMGSIVVMMAIVYPVVVGGGAGYLAGT